MRGAGGPPPRGPAAPGRPPCACPPRPPSAAPLPAPPARAGAGVGGVGVGAGPSTTGRALVIVVLSSLRPVSPSQDVGAAAAPRSMRAMLPIMRCPPPPQVRLKADTTCEA